MPLFVWNTGRKPLPSHAAWGEAARVVRTVDFQLEIDRVFSLLTRQWIVWLRGTHLPQGITLDPSAEGISLLR